MKSYSILLASFLVILVNACSSGPQIIVVPEETYRAYATYHKATCNLYKKAYAMLDKAEKARSRFAQHCKRTHPKRIFVRQNDQIIARAAITYGALLEDKAIFRAAGAETQKVEKKYSSEGKDLYVILIALGTPEHIAEQLIDSTEFKAAVQATKRLERAPLENIQ